MLGVPLPFPLVPSVIPALVLLVSVSGVVDMEKILLVSSAVVVMNSVVNCPVILLPMVEAASLTATTPPSPGATARTIYSLLRCVSWEMARL